jgi:hypothetical protein
MPVTYFTCASCGRAAALTEFEVRCPYCHSSSGTYSAEPPPAELVIKPLQQQPGDTKPADGS